MNQKKIVLTGDRPTGKLHLGHYFGSLANRINLQNQQNTDGSYKYQQFIMIADMQALTDNADNSKKITDSITELLLDYYAVGLINLDKTPAAESTIFIQSAIPALSELTMYYMNLVTESRVTRNPTVKAEREQKKWQGGSVPFGFLAYPISQAADITAFKADLVPVGADQLPMIELTNEIVEKVNKNYGPLLQPAQALINPETKLSRILGTDGEQKMSKSLNNAIFLSDTADELYAKIKKMRTCTRATLQDSGTLAGNTVFYFLELMECWYKSNNLTAEFLTALPCWKQRYLQGGDSNEDYAKDSFLKKQLFEIIDSLLAPLRKRRHEGKDRLGDIYKKICLDNQSANLVANNTLHELKCAIGLNNFNNYHEQQN